MLVRGDGSNLRVAVYKEVLGCAILKVQFFGHAHALTACLSAFTACLPTIPACLPALGISSGANDYNVLNSSTATAVLLKAGTISREASR